MNLTPCMFLFYLCDLSWFYWEIITFYSVSVLYRLCKKPPLATCNLGKYVKNSRLPLIYNGGWGVGGDNLELSQLIVLLKIIVFDRYPGMEWWVIQNCLETSNLTQGVWIHPCLNSPRITNSYGLHNTGLMSGDLCCMLEGQNLIPCVRQR